MKPFDTWYAANFLTENFGLNAGLIASELAEISLDSGDALGGIAWTNVKRALDDLVRVRPRAGERVH